MKKIYYFLLAVCLLTANVAYAQDAGSFTIVDGDIQINSQEDFDKWIVAMNETEDFYDQDVDLNVDVEVASTYDSPFYVVPRFNAEFNGNGHKLTLNLSTSEEEHEAGLTFIQLLYGTVKNLYVDGTIESSVKCMGPIAKDLCENSVVENVCSTVDIVSGINGDGTHGGIAGRCTGNSTIRNVVFAGSIKGEATINCAGFVGWNSSILTVENSLMIANIEVVHQGSNTICRGSLPACKNVFSHVEIGQTPDGCSIVTAEQLASGAVCYALNGDQKNVAWYQNIGEDAIPVLDNTHKQVYASGEFTCNGLLVGEGTFTNEVTESNIPDHSYSCGVCENCGHVIANYVTQDAEGFYLIDTAEKLVYIANLATANPKTNIRITADLDMAEVTEKYTPITNSYSGIFDGGGHTISNLVISRPNSTNQGLIGVAGNCTVKNLTLDASCSIEGASYTAGFVGQTSGVVTIYLEGLVMHGKVIANGINAAGIWGCNMGNTAKAYIKNCAVTGSINGYDQTCAFCGYAGTGEKTVFENCWFISDYEVQGVYQNKVDEVFTRPGGNAAKYVNCYTNQGENGDLLNVVTPDMAESGELTYKLNGNQSEIAWYQTLGEDVLPTLDKTHKQVFFSGEIACNGELLTDGDFSNDGENNVADHEYTDGVCDFCGAEEPGFAGVEIDQFGFYLIDTADKFAYIAKKASKDPTINIRITEDLDFAEISETYQPIVGGYAGTIDGGGHTISNFIIDRPDVQMQALVGLAGACTIKNLTLDASCNIVGASYSAGFVGETTGMGTITFENVYMHGNVTCNGANGAAIYACNMSSTMTVVMTNCGVTGNVYGEYEAGALSGWVGGIGRATIENCWFVGTIEGYDNERAIFCRPANDVNLINCWSSFGSHAGVGKLSEDAAATGELTWLLNGQSFVNPTWYQNLVEGDLYPSLDSSRGIVFPTSEGYTSMGSDPESFKAFVNTCVETAYKYVESEDVQNYANAELLQNYVALIEQYRNVPNMTVFSQIYNAAVAKTVELDSSVQAYKAYDAAAKEMFDVLERRDDFSGDGRDFLESVYLGENVGPGAYDAAPNGTYEYIMEKRVLSTDLVHKEINWLKELFRIAVADGYKPGCDITPLMANTTFNQGFDGWQGALTNTGLGVAEVWSNEDCDMYQEIVITKPGVYELQVRGGYRPYDTATSTQLSPYIYLNGNANYLQTVFEGAIPVEEAIDGVNCNLTGATNDRPIENENGEIVAYAMNGMLSLQKAIQGGRHDNSVVLYAQEGEIIRVGLKQTYMGRGVPVTSNVGLGSHDWVGIGDIRLTYHGEMAESEEAIDRALKSMLARAATLLTTRCASDADYVKYPNWSQDLKDRLAEVVAKAEDADVTTKYALIEQLSAIFKEAVECKLAYKQFFTAVETAVNAAYVAYEIDENSMELKSAADRIHAEAIQAYEDGSMTTEDALECSILDELPVMPTIDENGVFHIANTAQYKYFVDTYANNNPFQERYDVVLDGDVKMNTDMMIKDFYGTFDGQDHTINVNIERSVANAAIFENIHGAIIKNLIVTGDIVSSSKYAAGIAAHAHQANEIYRVQSLVNIQGNFVGDATHAGIVSVNESGNLELSNSMFAGTISGTAFCNGGLVGWGSTMVLAKNCLVIADITADPQNGNIIGRNNVQVNNCYFLTPYGSTPMGAIQISAEELESGYVTYALNGERSDDNVVWRQDLGEDVTPTLNPTHKIVYMTEEGTFTNTKPEITDTVTLGDVNNDGSILVDDVVLTIDAVLGIYSEDFVFEAADMDGDGEILVNDVVQVINVVLGVEPATSKVRGMAGAEASETLSLESSQTGMGLLLSNAANYVAMQYDMVLPEGVSLADIRLASANSHNVKFREMPDGVVRVVVASLGNEAFKNDNILNMTFESAQAEEISIRNAFVVTRGGTMSKIGEVKAVVNGNTTAIESIASGFAKADIYDLNGRLVRKGATSVDGLKRGVYVINGKNIIVK